MGQEIFLAGSDSLKLTRAARRDPDLLLVPAERAHLSADQGPLDLGALRASLPEGLGELSPAHPLELTFFSRGARSESASIRSRSLLSALPESSFLEVIHADGTPWDYVGGGSLRLFVEAPGLSLLRMEQRLSELVKRGALTNNAAFFRLLTFPMEACGLYARDPDNPAFGECAFELDPVATPDELVAFLAEATRIRGLERARRAAELVQGGSGSPEETLLSFAFKLDFALGGIEAPAFLENEPIVWPKEVRGLIEHERMRPDFYWPKHMTASEYNGKEHVSEEAFEEDQRRVRDYQTCGISVFPASYRNVKTLPALNSYLARIAHSLAEHEGADYERRVLRALSDEGALHMRRVLLSHMLPAVPSEKPGW